MLKIDSAIEKIQKGIYNSNQIYYSWSNAWITDYGVEFFMVNGIARELMKARREDDNKTLYFELGFKEIRTHKNKLPRGRPTRASDARNRLDIAVYEGSNLSYAIEVKRNPQTDKCLKDLNRLAHLVKNGYAKYGIFAGVWYRDYTDNTEKKSIFYSKLDEHLESLKNCLDVQPFSTVSVNYEKRYCLTSKYESRAYYLVPYTLHFCKGKKKI